MRRPYTNDSDQPAYVGGLLIQPGETRTVDVPEPIVAEPEAPEDPQAALKALAAGKASDIIAAIPGLGTTDVSALLALEQAAAKPRTTVVSALEAELLERGSRKRPGNDEILQRITEIPEDDLRALLAELRAEDPVPGALVEAVELELMGREDARTQQDAPQDDAQA